MSENTDGFLWSVHGYLNEYIRFADTKASAVIAWSGAFLGTLVATDCHGQIWGEKFFSYWVTCMTLGAFVLLGLAFIFAIVVVAPSLSFDKQAKQGFIYWESIRQFESGITYSGAVSSCNDLGERVAQHNYELADIARKKFRLVNWSIRLAAAGSVLGVLTIFCA
ncbi:Pycsar system effector family protein [Adhaeretor mobilis]|uniref:Pycsar effector protein domain-containing protein n=1 Tax=Adhaeretor mobilis TaxID=1930276 RepID=A0A517MUB8_9BACT|nr:Pycsar system effector family protein [Adhaeretor mobilis]QDS98470.1 hypothetical protein HG15A2_17500 [Adhaeretor mobilis]